MDASGTTAYTYTIGGLLYTEDGLFSSDTVTNTYANRVRTAMALQQPTGFWTNGFIYDAAARLTNVTSQGGAFSYFYPSSGSQGLISEIMLPNTSYITNTYDSVMTPTWAAALFPSKQHSCAGFLLGQMPTRFPN